MTTHVLFVCTGNICRSAFAERYGRSLVGDVIDLTSAGTGAVVGAPIDPQMAAELEARNCETDGFAARQVDDAIVASADLILTMAAHHRTWILDDHPAAVKRTFTISQAATSLRAMTPDTQALEHLAANRNRARRRDDVADPYGRGRDAMSDAASSIGALLDQVLPVLARAV